MTQSTHDTNFRFRRFGDFVERSALYACLRITHSRQWQNQLAYWKEKGLYDLVDQVEKYKCKQHIPKELAEKIIIAIEGEVEIIFY